MKDEIDQLKKIIEKQNKSLKIYEEHYKKLQKEVEKLKEELLRYRGH